MATLTLTDDLADELAAAVEAGVPIATAAQAAGLKPSTVYQWLNGAKDGEVWPHTGTPLSPEAKRGLSRFADLIATARARFEAKQVQAIREDAEAFNQKTGLRDWRARAWILNNHPATRQTYRTANQVTVNHDGTVNHVMARLEQLSTDELLALADAAPTLPDPTNAPAIES